MANSKITLAPAGQPSRKRRWYVLALVLLVMAIPTGFVLFVQYQATSQIRLAEEQADKLDPGWRLEDLEAARARISDAENSALVVIETARLMPPSWINWTLPQGKGSSLYESLQELSPNQQLTDNQQAELRSQLQAAAPALDYGSKLTSLSRGRYPIKWNKDAVGTLLKDQQSARTVADLFRYDAIVHAQVGNLVKALNSAQAVLNSGRSLGDEPLAISCLIRLACDRLSVKTIEGALAQGLGDPAQLATLQRLLEDEATQPLQLTAARGERATLHQFLKVTERDGIDRAGYAMTTSALGPYFDDFVDKAKAVRAHPQYLRYSTGYAEIAKLPPWEQKNRLDVLARPEASLPSLLEALMRGDEPVKMALAFHNWLAQLRCAITGLALERYRQAEGHWPAALDDLVPKYLPSVPLDPFDGRPLRFRRVEERPMSGIVVFSGGPNGTYDGGRLERTNNQTSAIDNCFRLWDVKDRHQKQPPD